MQSSLKKPQSLISNPEAALITKWLKETTVLDFNKEQGRNAKLYGNAKFNHQKVLQRCLDKSKMAQNLSTYLNYFSDPTIDIQQIQSFVAELKGYPQFKDLDKKIVFQIINLLPRANVDVHAILNMTETQNNSQDLEIIVSLVDKHFPASDKKTQTEFFFETASTMMDTRSDNFQSSHEDLETDLI